MVTLPIIVDDLYIYPFSNARLEKVISNNDTVGNKINFERNNKELKSNVSDSYVRMYNGKITLEFDVKVGGYYFFTIMGLNKNKNNQFNIITINNNKTKYTLFSNSTDHYFNNWNEMPLMYKNNINSIYEYAYPIRLYDGINKIVIESSLNDTNEYFYDCLIISKNKYYKEKNEIDYFPNNNGLYLVHQLENGKFKDFENRKFRNHLDINIYNSYKYSLVLDRSYLYEQFIPLKYDLYCNDKLEVEGLASNTKPSLVGLIQPDLNNELLNSHFDIKLYMDCNLNSTHTEYERDFKRIFLRVKENYLFDLGYKDHINLYNNYENFFLNLNDLHLTEKLSIARKFKII